VPRLLVGKEAKAERVLNQDQPFHCIRCGKEFGTQRMLQSMLVKIAGHSMFSAPGARTHENVRGLPVVDMIEKAARSACSISNDEYRRRTARVRGAIPEDTARADLYALLAHLFHAAPDADLLAVLANADDVSAEAPHSSVGEAWRKLQSAASAADPEALAQEFQDLFVGVGSGEVMAYSSWHLTGFLMEEPLARLRDDLAQLGFSRLQSAAEPEDHVAALAEVMRLLVQGGNGIRRPRSRYRKLFHAPPAALVCALHRATGKGAERQLYRTAGS
jgi:TorA maturation chaperone TorD